MDLLKIEPTPSPNNMKLVVSELLPMGTSLSYTQENMDEAPKLLHDILEIEGVKSIYRVADFISLERVPKYDWEHLLPQVRSAFNAKSEHEKKSKIPLETDHGFGEVRVFTQMLFDLPMQMKIEVNGEEIRIGLPERFLESIMKAQSATSNVVFERKWVENYPRYGEVETIKKELVEEISAAYPEERLDELVKRALHPSEKPKAAYQKVTLEMLDDPDWKTRYAALDRMDPTLDDLSVLEKALRDEKVSIRRLAVVYFGLIEDSTVLPYLYKAMEDPTVTVRRTAGDALSDIGDSAAIPVMVKALQDPSKIVRWRAAMFLYEVGNATALEGLRAAKEDPEFEVALQIQMAIERIEGGQEAKGSVWKQMTEARQKNEHV